MNKRTKCWGGGGVGPRNIAFGDKIYYTCFLLTNRVNLGTKIRIQGNSQFLDCTGHPNWLYEAPSVCNAVESVFIIFESFGPHKLADKYLRKRFCAFPYLTSFKYHF